MTNHVILLFIALVLVRLKGRRRLDSDGLGRCDTPALNRHDVVVGHGNIACSTLIIAGLNCLNSSALYDAQYLTPGAVP